MCGIAGLLSPDGVEEGVLAAMNASLSHRGPDDHGLWLARDGKDPAGPSTVGLAQRRLAIIDLSPLGHNPMPRANGRLCITYNGEVYNFQALRKELEALGETFRSQSDTEVVLAAYDRWGPACLDRFVGMFAFALWDAARKRLFFARDRVGKKPLYYARYAGRLAFASELKAFLKDPDFPREIDPEALSLYLRFGYVPAPFSIYRAARKLPPAHFALWAPATSSLTIERYWDPVALARQGPLEIPDQEAEERLDALLTDAVRLRMIADVPLGAFLSGGIDSSLVVALMRESGAPAVKTFTIRFENPAFDEADHAAAVARHLGTEHSEEVCTAAAMRDVVDTLPDMLDEPFADSSAIPTYVVSRMTRRHVTVALSGDGGDELFFGYPRYALNARARWLLDSPPTVREGVARVASAFPVRRLRRAAEVLRHDDADRYLRFVAWFRSDEVAALTGRPVPPYPAYVGANGGMADFPAAERPPVVDLVTYLPEDILVKVDRASMAVGLESRAPLLDHRVAELALRLPLSMKWRGGTTKWLLRRLLHRRVPRTLLDRPKMGFGVPLSDWLKGPLRGRMEALLAGPALRTLALDERSACGLWEAFRSGRELRASALWALFALLSWTERWKPPALERGSGR
jgi:asparagine synthase (glutamine-hydrolysing)